MNTRDKFLTEAMGECWHEFDEWVITGICAECGKEDWCYQIDFSTWPGFGKLWEWAQQQEWWSNFFMWSTFNGSNEHFFLVKEILIHPDRFANAIYEFLKEREK